MRVQSKAPQIKIMVCEILGCEAAAVNLPGFPTPAERARLGRWMRSVSDRKPPLVSFLDGAIDQVDGDVVITLGKNVTVVRANITLTADETVNLLVLVHDLARARGFNGQIKMSKVVRLEAIDDTGVERLGRMRIKWNPAVSAA